MPDKPEISSTLASEYAAAIGHIVSASGSVEHHIDVSIWGLAHVPSGIGACLTAQIYTFDGRMKALVALMRLRKAPDSLVKEANRLHENARGPLEIRNRVVHDYWCWDEKGETYRIEATAAKVLKLEAIPVELAQLQEHHKTISALVERAGTLKEKIYDALPSLPEIPESELHPIRFRRRDR